MTEKFPIYSQLPNADPAEVEKLLNMPFDKYIEKFGPLKRLKKPVIDKPVENNRLRELLNKNESL